MRATSLLVVEDRHVRVGADAQVPLLRQSQRPRRAGRGDDGDLGQRVLAVQLRQDDALQRLGRQLLELLAAEVGVHQQLDDLRVAPEGGAVGMVGGQVDAPGIVDEQQQLQPDGPLHGVDQVLFLVDVGDDAAAGLVLHVEVAPLAAGQLVEQVLPGAVGGDRHGVAEQHGAGVGGEVRMGVELLGDRRPTRSASCASRRRRRRGTAGGPGGPGCPPAPSSSRAWW